MRDILTGLAIILIVALTTMLVAPYFVDWNGQRGFLEAQLSRALGQKVTIGGGIDLKLLPTPYIRLNQAVIGGDEAAVRIGIHHLDLELAVAPLLHGEIDVVEGRLDEPTIRLTLQLDRTLPALADTPAFRADVRLERIIITDGTLAIADPQSGRTFVVEHLDFDTDAPSLAGPFKAKGAAGAGAGRTQFRFSTTEAKQGRTHLHVAIGETGTHPGLDADGDVTLAQQGDAVRPRFAGTATAIGRLSGAADQPVAWRLSGPLVADPSRATLEAGEMRLGSEDAGVSLKADLQARFDETAGLDVTLAAAQLDIDRLGGLASDPARTPTPPQLPSPASLRALFSAATPPLPTKVDVSVETATWGGETLSGLSAQMAPAPDGTDTLKASGDGPGGLHLELDGKLPTGAPRFEGRLALGADDLPHVARWLKAVAPDLSSFADAPVTEARFGGMVTIDGSGIGSRRATLDLDRTALAGPARMAFASDGKPAKIAADLRAGTLDLEALPDLHAFDSGGVDLDLKLRADGIKVAKLGSGALQSGPLTLDLASNGGRLDLRGFRAENLGGATVTAKGSLDSGKASFQAGLDAAKLDATAALVQQLLPGTWADAFAARAASLAPAKLQVEAVLSATDDKGHLEPSQLTVKGTLASTTIVASLAPSNDRSGETSLNVRADTPESATLLRQLGLAPAPDAPTIEAGRLTLSGQGRIDRPMDTKVVVLLGSTRLDVAGQFDLLGKAQGGSGTMVLASPDLRPLLRSMALVSNDADGKVPANVTGGLAVGQTGVALGDLKGNVAGTSVTGTLKIAPASGDAPVLTGSLDLDHSAVGSLAAWVLGPTKPPAADVAWSNEPFAEAGSLPRAALTLRARTIDLAQGLAATDASLDLTVAPGLVAASHGEASLLGGRIGGSFTLRRDDRQASLEGSLDAAKLAVDLPGLRAGASGKLDFAGSGATALALVGSLAGSGSATLADVHIPGADPTALPRIFNAVEDDTLAVDDEAVTRAFDEAAKAPLDAGTRRFGLGLAGGTLTLTPQDEPASGGPVTSVIDATLDLRGPRLAVRATETLHALPSNWSGPPPSLVVIQAGTPRAPRRSVEVAAFINAVAARAIARESARIEAYEFDIRERALFNARLQSDRRREQDRLKAEADAKAAAEAVRRALADLARKADADRRAKAEAARLERQRTDDLGRAGPDGTEAPRAPAQDAQPAEPRPRFEAPPPGTLSDPGAAGRY